MKVKVKAYLEPIWSKSEKCARRMEQVKVKAHLVLKQMNVKARLAPETR